MGALAFQRRPEHFLCWRDLVKTLQVQRQCLIEQHVIEPCQRRLAVINRQGMHTGGDRITAR
ncbi:hypothetical protein BKM17_09580 [Pseudomonas syringae group genomosp. 3]|nr:hypothetical protein BKM17_09580 [Pseudomonas syringae group genomosp. 3]